MSSEIKIKDKKVEVTTSSDLGYVISRIRFNERMLELEKNDLYLYKKLENALDDYVKSFASFCPDSSDEWWGVLYNQIDYLVSRIKRYTIRVRGSQNFRISPQKMVDWLFDDLNHSKDAERFMSNLQYVMREKKTRVDAVLYFFR